MHDPTAPTDADRLEALETIVGELLGEAGPRTLRVELERVVEARLREYKTTDGLHWTRKCTQDSAEEL